MGALGELGERGEQPGDLGPRRRVAEDRQAEGRLGDEDVAGHRLEAGAGRVGGALVVAGRDDAQAAALDRDLRRAEHVAGGVERDRDAAEPHRPPQLGRLGGAREASPSRIAMMSSVSRVASTAPWPPVAWSEWPWVTSARAPGGRGR